MLSLAFFDAGFLKTPIKRDINGTFQNPHNWLV